MKQVFFTSRIRSDPQFNMTSMIDVVFLLIIFFMLICQFIVRENYELEIPDNVPNAVVPEHPDQNAITVSVFPGGSGSEVMYAVRSRQFDPDAARYTHNPLQLVQDMAQEIEAEFSKKSGERVYLRADKSLTYGQVQRALWALSQAGASRVQLAAYRDEQGNQADER